MDSKISRRAFLLGAMAYGMIGCQRRGDPYELVLHRANPRAPLLSPEPGMQYFVKRGDTLSSISRRSGLSVQRIIQVNELEGSLLHPGDRLFLPGVHALIEDPLADELALANEPDPSGDYVVIARERWAQHGMRANKRRMGAVTRITLHHTGEHAGLVGRSDPEVVQRIENAHRGRGWSGIGYHYLIGKDGKVYEGRPRVYQGAHVSGGNSNNLGISVIGEGHRSLPSARQIATVRRFLDDMRSEFGVGLGRVYGHRDISPSICPGDKLYRWLQDYKRG